MNGRNARVVLLLQFWIVSFDLRDRASSSLFSFFPQTPGRKGGNPWPNRARALGQPGPWTCPPRDQVFEEKNGSLMVRILESVRECVRKSRVQMWSVVRLVS